MKHLITALLAVGIAATAQGQNINSSATVDIQKSKVEWKGTKVIGSSHTGEIKLKSGTLEFQSGQLTGGNFIIDMTSITNTDLENPEYNAKLVGHLKSEDFFGVEKNPTASLTIKSVKKSTDAAKGTHLIKGDLIIKGKSNPVEFYATVKNSGKIYTSTATIVFDRSKFDVRYGSDSFFDNLGDKAISNDIEIKVSLVTK